jgi:cation diffusion facilitator family transporter
VFRITFCRHKSGKNTTPVTNDFSSAQLIQEKQAAARLSLISNLCLLVIKVVVGVVTGSVSVLSEAAHSASDLFASALTFFSVRVVDLPPDERHPYGHGKAEGLSTLGQAMLLSIVACYVVYEAVARLLGNHEPQRVEWGMAVMVASAITNIFVVRFILKVAHKTNSLALASVSKDHLADIYAAVGVLIGLVLVRVTGKTYFDSLLAIAVAALILRSAWHLFQEALELLLDTQLPAEEIALVKEIFENEPKVLGYHKLRTRKSGSMRHIDAHILMDDHLTLLEAHDITEEIEDRIRAAFSGAEVVLHTEPFHAEQLHQQQVHNQSR